MTLSCLCGRQAGRFRAGDEVVIRPETQHHLEFPYTIYARKQRRGAITAVIDETTVHVSFPSPWPFVRPRGQSFRITEIDWAPPE